MFTKTFIRFQTACGSFLYSQNFSKCFKFFCSTDPGRFLNEEQRKISAVDLLIKVKTTSLILIGPYVFVQKAESNAYSTAWG